MGNLTVRKIEETKPKSKPFKLMDGSGLQLRVATNGVKTWLVRYVVFGEEKQYTIPRPYRDSGGEGYASLADAREESAKIHAFARQGIDYKVMLIEKALAEQKRREQEQADNKTVNDLFDAWVPETDRKDNGTELRRLFGRDVLPRIGAKPVREVTEDDARKILKEVVGRGSNRMAVMLLADMKQMFRWAEKQKAWRKLIEDNPTVSIRASKITDDDYENTERDRTLSVAEIRELKEKLPSSGLSQRAQIACWIMLSCCCRIGELLKARWTDVNFEEATWFIPRKNAKNRNAHLVRLSDFSLLQFQLLKELSEGDWCFTNRDGLSHLDEKTITKQIRDRQLSALNRKPMIKRSSKADALILSEGDWRPHDLRRTGSTMMQQLRIRPEVIDRVLNHIEPDKLKRIYQTYDYDSEKKEAWMLLGKRLELILNQNASNVIPLEISA